MFFTDDLVVLYIYIYILGKKIVFVVFAKESEKRDLNKRFVHLSQIKLSVVLEICIYF